jgi:hypothetical protein
MGRMMAKSSHFVALVAAGVLAAAGLLVLVVHERSVEATSPGKPGKIAYSAYDGTNEAIYTIDPGGGGRFKVTDKPRSARTPAYSPTGNKIAYSGHRQRYQRLLAFLLARGQQHSLYRLRRKRLRDLYDKRARRKCAQGHRQ